jgi:hypothetical protein
MEDTPMGSKQPTSPEESEGQSSKAERETGETGAALSSQLENDKPVKPEAPYVLTGDAVRALIGEKPKQSKLQALSTHPLALVVISGAIGVGLTQFYTYRLRNLDYTRSVEQQELVRRQNFSDEVNKLRIQKFGEVWEELDEHEHETDRLLDDSGPGGSPEEVADSKSKKVEYITSIIRGDQAMVSRNRFWLGEDLCDKTIGYLDMNVKYAVNKIFASRTTDLSELIEKRKNAKQDILKIRKLFLEGEF